MRDVQKMKTEGDHGRWASQPPFFSVVITTYNRIHLLKRALHSLIQQMEADWEGIIVDDGSTDGTSGEIASFLRSTHRISYYRQNNKGYVQAKNAGIFLSVGRYITFLDSDDEYHPNHLSERKQFLTKHPKIDLLHGGVEVIGSHYVPDRFNREAMVHVRNCAIGGTFFIRNELAHRLHGFNSVRLGDDAEFLDRAKQIKAKIAKIELPTYIYHRENKNSITHTVAAES